MRIKELRALSSEDLKRKLKELDLEVGIERRKVAATGVSSKKVKLREMKRTAAKILTLLTERGAAA